MITEHIIFYISILSESKAGLERKTCFFFNKFPTSLLFSKLKKATIGSAHLIGYENLTCGAIEWFKVR